MPNFPILLVSSAMICIETYDTFVSRENVCSGENDTSSIVPVDIKDTFGIVEKVCVEIHDTLVSCEKVYIEEVNTFTIVPVDIYTTLLVSLQLPKWHKSPKRSLQISTQNKSVMFAPPSETRARTA